MFSKLFGRRRWEDESRDLYESLVAQARRVEFYTAGGVADSIDGRFDLVILHAFLLMRRLGGKGQGTADAAALGQVLFDLMFADFDQCLREMGVTDMGMSPKIKKMTKAFYGRVAAYDGSLEDGAALSAALERNLYRGNPPSEPVLAAMAAYVQAQAADLDNQPLGELMKGRVRFIAPQLP